MANAPYIPEPDYTRPRAPRENKIVHTTTVRMTKDEHEWLCEEASRQGRSKNSILRQAIVALRGEGQV